MTPEDALEFLKKLAMEQARTILYAPRHHNIDKVLSVLSTQHAYFSRFKVGDEVWCYVQKTSAYWVPVKVVFEVACSNGISTLRAPDGALWYRFNHEIFATDAEAQAECERRNKT